MCEAIKTQVHKMAGYVLAQAGRLYRVESTTIDAGYRTRVDYNRCKLYRVESTTIDAGYRSRVDYIDAGYRTRAGVESRSSSNRTRVDYIDIGYIELVAAV